MLILSASLEVHAETRAASLWKTSVAVLAGATAADAATSIGRVELNPLLRSADGRFHARGVAIKAAITGGAVAAQWLMLRNNSKAGKYAAAANFAAASLFAGVAARNATNSRAQAGSLPSYVRAETRQGAAPAF